MDTFTPPVAPSMSGTEISETPRLITNNFGDGYQQSIPDGLNNTPNSAMLNWDPLTIVNLNTILNFLRAHVGITFFYQLPDESVARKWQAGGWKRAWRSYNMRSLSVTFTERFDQGASVAGFGLNSSFVRQTGSVSSGVLSASWGATEIVVPTNSAVTSLSLSGAPVPLTEGWLLRLWFPAGGSYAGVAVPVGAAIDLEVYSNAWNVVAFGG